jgi:hypothetical protein
MRHDVLRMASVYPECAVMELMVDRCNDVRVLIVCFFSMCLKTHGTMLIVTANDLASWAVLYRWDDVVTELS